jgi:hypothetical protein
MGVATQEFLDSLGGGLGISDHPGCVADDPAIAFERATGDKTHSTLAHSTLAGSVKTTVTMRTNSRRSACEIVDHLIWPQATIA